MVTAADHCRLDEVQFNDVDDEIVAAGRARIIARRRQRHWSMLAICVFVILFAMALTVRPDQRVELLFAPGWPAPESCASRLMWGYDCPGCGLTRGFVYLAHGDIWSAWRINRMSWLLAAALLAQFPYRLWRLRELAAGHIVPRRWPAWFGQFLIFALIANWLLKQYGG